jgi:hypothetical protein
VPSSSTTASSGSSTNVGAIAGGVVGGIAVLGAILCGAIFLCLRRRKAKQASIDPYTGSTGASGGGGIPTAGPFTEPSDMHQQLFGEQRWGQPQTQQQYADPNAPLHTGPTEFYKPVDPNNPQAGLEAHSETKQVQTAPVEMAADNRPVYEAP